MFPKPPGFQPESLVTSVVFDVERDSPGMPCPFDAFAASYGIGDLINETIRNQWKMNENEVVPYESL